MDEKSSLRGDMQECVQISDSAPPLPRPLFWLCDAGCRSVCHASGLGGHVSDSCPGGEAVDASTAPQRNAAPAPAGAPAAAARKRPQTSAPLKSPAPADETRHMPLSLSPTQNRSDRQLVFTSSQAARYLGVSLATIRRWTDAGHISCYRTPGGQRRFSRDQLDDFIASMHRGGNAARGSGAEHRAAASIA